MTDLTPLWPPVGPRLPHRKGGKIVVEHELLRILLGEPIHDLLVVSRSQGHHHQSLRFSTGEQGRAMNAGQAANLNRNLPDVFWPSPVGPRSAQDHLALGLLRELEEELLDQGSIWGSGNELSRCGVQRGCLIQGLLDDRFHRDLPGLLSGCPQRRWEQAKVLSLELREERGMIRQRLQRHFWLAALTHELLLQLNDLLDDLMRTRNGPDHEVLGDLVAAGLDHG